MPVPGSAPERGWHGLCDWISRRGEARQGEVTGLASVHRAAGGLPGDRGRGRAGGLVSERCSAADRRAVPASEPPSKGRGTATGFPRDVGHLAVRRRWKSVGGDAALRAVLGENAIGDQGVELSATRLSTARRSASTTRAIWPPFKRRFGRAAARPQARREARGREQFVRRLVPGGITIAAKYSTGVLRSYGRRGAPATVSIDQIERRARRRNHGPT